MGTEKFKVRRDFNLSLYSEYNKTLRSWLIAFIAMMIFLMLSACGGSDSDSHSEQDYNIAWLTINASHVNVDEGDTAHISLSGKAFISPDYTASYCVGLACLFTYYDNSYPGVNVTWHNLTTGDAGSATSRYGTLTSFEHLWQAYVSVTSGINNIQITAADPAGNVATKTITIDSGPDILPPSVIATKPSNNEGFVSLYDPITVWFSESIDPATVNENSFTISASGGGTVNGYITISESGTSATFSLLNFLAANTNYTATLTTDISDISGKQLSENYIWSFATGEGDFVAPSVTDTVPQDGTVGVSVFKGISTTFSELMDHDTITTSTFTVYDADTNKIDGFVSITSSGSVDIATFTPNNPLQTSSLYSVMISSGVSDIAGNTLQNDYSWSFTTMAPDTTPPSVESVEPLNGETCVALDKIVSVTFDEDIDTSTLNATTFMLTDLDNNPLGGQISTTGTTSTFMPYIDLAFETTYQATVTTGAKDLSGNPLSLDYSWLFTTETTSKGSWTPLSTTNVPSGRDHHTAVWTGNEMIVWGGAWNSITNTGGRYHLLSDSWQPTNITGAPLARIDHTAIWTGSEMIIWGGHDYNQTLYSSGARYDPLTDTWQAISMDGAPSPRRYHIAIWTGSEMIIWGGSDGTQSLNDGARYNPATDTWQPMSITDAPKYNYGFDWSKAVWTGSEMILLNKYNFNPDHGGRYDPSTDTWQPISPDGAPPYGTTIENIVWTGVEVFVWGWRYFSAYNPSTDSWRQLPRACSPSSRSYSEGVWTGNEMIIWGGLSGSSRLDSGGLYHPMSNLWSSTSLSNAPSPRSGHTAVWTGNEMLIWGGIGGNNVVDAGGKYIP